ncbi:LysE family translocator [Fictibacillus barbaricus]|uniref:LysE family translocator n=1 Tax=Fictibacillus barbaricus TaxID=182136 RepID=A0ABS2ZFX9_9BACL|nr:LysE family translocator [Fictibacillus barbaricus]MBN3545524.1 LysE family translocator [Fictibacillus barbaricus]GGB54105.1 lysine transporter LysE [Fictibacillus barbaricus]
MMTFIFVVLLLFLIPGPAVFITISQTIKGGKKIGIITGLGIAVGDLIHTFAAVLGLSAILMTSAFAFEVVKYMGAAYLVYLGISALINKTKKVKKPTVETVNPNVSFRQALLIELLNPKTALFFLAFLPQFVRSDSYPVTIQLLILGLTFVLMSIIYTTFITFLTSIIGQKLFTKTNQSLKWVGKAVALVYIGLGLKLAFETQE